MTKVTIIGGGTGTFVVTKALTGYEYELSKIVAVFDSGGSTARLRDEFGFLPVGDMRQSLAALAHENGNAWIRQLLLYRFDKGAGLEGHNLGNLILTALQDMTGSTPQALEVAAKIFRLKGKVFPVTLSKSDLQVTYQDGSVEIGEHRLDEMEHGGRRIKSLSLTKPCLIYSGAKQAILDANYIILGPGDLYASILPNLVVKGAKSAIKASPAKLVYIVNLMTRYTQTHDYTAADHVTEIERYLGRQLDYILVNTGPINPQISKVYQKHQEYQVVDDLVAKPGQHIVHGDFASSVPIQKTPGDQLPRALMRHDQKKLTTALLKIIQ